MTNLKEETLEQLSKLEWETTDCFSSYYQDGTKPDERLLTLNQLITAYHSTKSRLIQFDVKPTLVASLEVQIFQTDDRLKKDPLIHEIQGDNFLIGGRHRIWAIVSAFNAVAAYANLDKEVLYRQLIRVDTVIKNNFINFEDDILADNDTRRMLKAEKVGIKSQKLGANPSHPISFIETAFDNYQSPDALSNTCAQYFVWEYNASTISTQTRQDIGKVLSIHILFGNQRRTKKTRLLVTNPEEFKFQADLLWSAVMRLVASRVAAGKRIVAREAKEIAKEAIENIGGPSV